MASPSPDDGAASAARAMPLGLRALTSSSPLILRRLGIVARRARAFGRIVGVSGAVRRDVLPATGPALDVVRLPDGVLPRQRPADDPSAAAVAADPGMAAIAQLYRRRRPVADPVRRGLPSSARRGALTASGELTGPSAVARRLQPAEVRVRRNESHGADPARSTPSSSTPSTSTPSRSTPSRSTPAVSRATSAPRSGPGTAPRRPAAAGTPGAPTERSEAGLAVAAYARADTPDAKAAAFAAAMGLTASPPTTGGDRNGPPSAAPTTAARRDGGDEVVARRPTLWAAAAGRHGGFGDDAEPGDAGSGEDAAQTGQRPGGLPVAGRFAAVPPVAGGRRPSSEVGEAPPARGGPEVAPVARRTPRGEPDAGGPGAPGPSAPSGRAAPSTAPTGAARAASIAVASRLEPQLHRSAFRSREAHRSVTGPVWRGGLPGLHAASGATSTRFLATVEARVPGARPDLAGGIRRTSTAAIGATPRSPLGWSTSSVLARVPAPAEDTDAAIERPSVAPPRRVARPIALAHAGRALHPGSIRRVARQPVPADPAGPAGPPTSVRSAGRPTSAGAMAVVSDDRGAGRPVPEDAGTVPSSGRAVEQPGPGGSPQTSTGGRSAAADVPSVAPGRPAGPAVRAARPPTVAPDGPASGGGRTVDIAVRRTASAAADTPPPTAVDPALGDPWVALGRRAGALPLAARQTLTAALGAGSAIDDESSATPPGPPVARGALPPPSGAPVARGIVPTPAPASAGPPATATATDGRMPAAWPRRDAIGSTRRAVAGMAAATAIRRMPSSPSTGTGRGPAMPGSASPDARPGATPVTSPLDAGRRSTASSLQARRRSTTSAADDAGRGSARPPALVVPGPARRAAGPMAAADPVGHGPGSLARTIEAPGRTLGAEPIVATALPPAAPGTDPATVRLQDRFVEALAAAATPATAPGQDGPPTRSPVASRPDHGRTGAAPSTGAPSGGSVLRSARAAPRPAPAAVPVVPGSSLPARFRPLTTSLVARRVRIAHGPASRAALRAVGRPAATLGDVVHLTRAPDASAATTELLAHELVHAAGFPARPRFYDEPGHDAEERVARQVGRLARAVRPEAAEARTVRRSAAAPVLPRVVQRVDPPAAPAPPSITSAPPAASMTPVASAAATGQLVRRSVAGGATSGGQPIRRVLGAPTEPEASGSATTARLNDLEELLRLLEQRVLNELERRGGRTRGGW